MYYLNFPIELHSRRGLKATFLLVPLFGIQLFFITYRPTEQNEHRLLYEIISKIIIDSQVSMISNQIYRDFSFLFIVRT
jgi:calcitonin receptor-like